jgi:hypothetical protein
MYQKETVMLVGGRPIHAPLKTTPF